MRIYVNSCLEVLCFVYWKHSLVHHCISKRININSHRIIPFKMVHASVQVNNYPTLFIYPAEDKSNPVCLEKQM